MDKVDQRREAFETIVLLFVVYVAVLIGRYWPNFQDSIVGIVITLFTAKGVYELIIKSCFWFVNNTNLGLRIYWGHLYLKGLWSYEYHIGNERFIGIWSFEQDVNGTRVIGNGLTEDFISRSFVRSVSPLINDHGGYYFINLRSELGHQNAPGISKTTLIISKPRHIFGAPRTIRAFTEVFGGPTDKQFHQNVVFKKHDDVESIEELIAVLRKEAVANSQNSR